MTVVFSTIAAPSGALYAVSFIEPKGTVKTCFMEGKHTEAFQLSEVVRSSQSKTRRQRTCLLDSQWRMRLEFTILVVVIVIVWGLFSLPIVFYYDSSSKVW